jgi:hypothetical protein
MRNKRGLLLGFFLAAQMGQLGAADDLRLPRFVQKAYTSQSRSLDGKPGKAYWQNRSIHKMSVSVAPPNRQITGSEEITYFNNSPDALSSLTFRLYLNAHRAEAIREFTTDAPFLTSGVHVDGFQVEGESTAWDDPKNPDARSNKVGSTIHVIQLKKPLAPHSSIRLAVRWHYDLAECLGWKEGVVDNNTYFLAYFFPRVAVYSDTSGWDTLPFSLSREFSNDFADFEFEVKTPKNFVVWATGDLQNPQEVLQPAYARRLADSFTTDQVIHIAKPEEVKQGLVTAQSDTLSWKWKADNVPDVAIAVSNHYNWDAGSVVVDPASGRRASVQSAYSNKALDFVSMVEFGKKALGWASTHYPGVAYPFSKTTIIEAGADEEYPMMANDGSIIGSPHEKELPNFGFTGFVAAHELLHSWFPFYMGVNEKRYPFMDEGWTTAFEHLFLRDTQGVEPAVQIFKNMRANVWSLEMPGSDTPIITPHDVLLGGTVSFAANGYGKAALGYLALKDLMGETAFKQSLHAFIQRWNGKHPLPWDMFNTFNNVSGKNYNWFFHNWFYEPNYLDIGVQSVRPDKGGYTLDVRNTGGMAMPFDVQLVYQDGSKESLHQTPAVWQRDIRRAQVKLRTARKLESLHLDGGIWTDFRPDDNGWKVHQLTMK